MGTPETPAILLEQQFWPVVVALVCAGLVYLLLKVSAERRQHKLSRQREGVTEKSFTEHLAKYGFDPVIVASTYRYLREVQRVQFPIVPADALDEDLGLDSEDVDQTVRELSVALHRGYTPGLRYAPVVTVEDLVRLLQASPRVSLREQRVAA